MALVAVAVVVAVVGTVAVVQLASPPPPQLPKESSDCPMSDGLCIEGDVTRVIDGDTLEVEDDLRIRLVLVDAPELSQSGGPEARDFLTDLCLGFPALVDEDDLQIGDDPFGRILAVVHCDGTNANAAMISSGHAETYYDFCAESEFEDDAWTGCDAPPPPPPPPPPREEGCDPAYPTVCIPPPPPDLDCGDIAYRNFEVLAPDPHHFDGDGDGVGCET